MTERKRHFDVVTFFVTWVNLYSLRQGALVISSTMRLWAILCFVIIAVPVHAHDSGLNKTVRVGIFPSNPVNYIDKYGSSMGLNPDLLREIFRNDSIRLAFVPGSWQDGLKRLQDEEIDLMMAVAFSEKRAKMMDYGKEPVLQLWGQVFTRPHYSATEISDLFNQKVGVMTKDISGNNFIDTVKKLGGKCQIVEYQDHDDVFNAVQNGEVVAGVAPQHFGIRNTADYNLIPTSILFSPFPIYFTSKKGRHRDVLDHIDSHLAEWKKESGSIYHKTLNKWMAPADSGQTLPTWLLPAFFIILTAVLFCVCFILLLNSTVRRKTHELKESETRFKDVTFNISDWVWEINMQGIYTYCSEHSYELLGYTPKELIGKSSFDFLAPPGVDQHLHPFKKIIESGQSFRNRQITCVTRDGKEIFLQASALPIFGEHKALLGYRGIVTDITAKKQAEDERLALEEKLSHAQKMEAVGTLAGGIAHDFNNILAAILGYTQLAMGAAPAGSQIQHDLKEIHQAGVRARELVKQILAFSRQADTSCIILQPAHIINEVVKMLRPSLPATIEIRPNIERTDHTVLADPSQLHQIVMNLCTNAFHAMEEQGGFLDINMKTIELSANDLSNEPEILPGPFMQISVADSGIGIPSGIRDKIFDPYFTTKEVGKGSGMGLAITHGIVKSYGGLVTCYSQPGEGTIFHVYLPIQMQSHSDQSDSKDITPTGHERILFIDDEEIIVDMTRKTLELLGYKVQTATSGKEALNIFEKDLQQFDLVITDQTMPNMTGDILAAKLLQLRPDLPIILCTGYSSIINKEKAKAIGVREFTFKPLAQKEIADLIRKVLDTPKTGD